MDEMGLGVGLAAIAFWGFVAVVTVAGIWDGIRKRDAKHETIRRLIESGRPIDQELLKKLSLVSDGGNRRHDQDFYITGLWLTPIAVGLAIFALILGSTFPSALVPMLGAAALVGCFGAGCLVAAKFAARWHTSDRDSAD